MDISTRSQCNNMVSPIPTPTPFTAAMTGLGKVSSTGMNRWYPGSESANTDGSFISVRSWPAEKARPAPVITTHRRSSSVAASPSAAAVGIPQLLVEGVQRVGAVQGQDPDPVGVVDQERCVIGHHQWVAADGPPDQAPRIV